MITECVAPSHHCEVDPRMIIAVTQNGDGIEDNGTSTDLLSISICREVKYSKKS